jgi:hypothetical protein
MEPEAHYDVYKNPPVVPTWGRWNQSTSSPLYFSKIHSNIIFLSTPPSMSDTLCNRS